ncbi:hypothetical protein J5A68_02335 [Prevotella melaninogenica]|nr:hypothetical protein J5A68_02335 [Prevotella melaninogenica]
MNQKQEKAYIRPLTTFVVISEKECIMNSSSSASGGHHSAGDDETLTAKGFNFFSDEEYNCVSEIDEN